MLIYIYALHLCKKIKLKTRTHKRITHIHAKKQGKQQRTKEFYCFQTIKTKTQNNKRSKQTQPDCFCVCFVCVCVCVCLCRLCCVFQFVCFTGWCCCAVVFLRLSRWLFLFPAWFSVVVSPSYPPHPPTLNALTCCTCTPCDSVAVVGLEPYNLASPGY